MMGRTVYFGIPDLPRQQCSEHETSEAIKKNVAPAMMGARDSKVDEIAGIMQSVDEQTPLKGTRYTFGYGVEVRHGSRLLDTVYVLSLRDALRQIEREVDKPISFSLLERRGVPINLVSGKDWTNYGFVIIEDFEWGPLMSSTPDLAIVRQKHKISPKRIAELLTLTTNAQVGLQHHAITTLGVLEERLLRGIYEPSTQYGIQLPTELAFQPTNTGDKEIYEWHVRVNKWEQEFTRTESELGILVGEAAKGHLAWSRHDDEKEGMVLSRCIEYMWALGQKHGKRRRIRDACRQWMADRHQTTERTDAVIELIDRFYDQVRNIQAHVATGQPFQTDIERAHLNARVRGVIEDYIWWNLTGEFTQSRPKVISRGEEGGSHAMLWSQMWEYWKGQGLPVEEIVRLWT